MYISPNQLQEEGYTELDVLNHQELLPFVRTYIKKRTAFSILYYSTTAVAAGLTVFLLVYRIRTPNYHFANQFLYACIGFLLTFALVPLHEYIHVLAYHSQGAKQTSYDVNFKKFYFMALADKFVASKKEFQVVALAPFVSISLSLIMALFFVNDNWRMALSVILFMHTSMCAGDFGLLSYFEFHKDKEVVTYDVVNEKITYFYGKLK